jgi:hypothetical protein
VLVNGVPLRQEQLNPDDLEETIVTTILRLTQDLQKAVFNVRLLLTYCLSLLTIILSVFALLYKLYLTW